MKIDLTKFPMDWAVVLFLLGALAVTFFLAFDWASTDHDDDVAGVPGEPTPAPVVPGDGDAILVEMGDNFFEPDEIVVEAGTIVTFELPNIGAAIHNMHIANEDGEYETGFCSPESEPCSDPARVSGGGSAVLVWEVYDLPGAEIPFRCDFHVQDMTGVIRIQ